LVDFRSR